MNKSAYDYVDVIEKVAFDKNKYFTNNSIEKYISENDPKSVKRSLGAICYTIDLDNGNFDKALNYVENKRGMKIKEKFDPEFPLIYSNNKKDYSGRDLGLAIAQMQENFSPERIDDVKKISKAIDEINEKKNSGGKKISEAIDEINEKKNSGGKKISEAIDEINRRKIFNVTDEINRKKNLGRIEALKNNMPKKNKNLVLAGAVAVPLTAAAAYGIYRHNKKKKENDEA